MASKDLSTEVSYNDEALTVCVELACQADWQTPMMSAPTCISLIAHCMAMTVSNDDISLASCTPPKGFQYLVQPQSLRACMRQLCNATYTTMSNAQNKMLAISMAANSIPNNIRTIYEALTLFSLEEKKIIIPRQSQIVQREAEKCARWSIEIRDQFSETRELLSELLYCCDGKQKKNEDAMKVNDMNNQKYDQILKKKDEDLKKHQAAIEKGLAERERLQKDINALSAPTLEDKVGDLLDRVQNLAGKVASYFIGRPIDQIQPVINTSVPLEIDPLPLSDLGELSAMAQNFTNLLSLPCDDRNSITAASDMSSYLGGMSSVNPIFDLLNEYPKALLMYANAREINSSKMLENLSKQRELGYSNVKKLYELIRRAQETRRKNSKVQDEARAKKAMAQERVTKLALNANILANINAQTCLIEQRMEMAKAEQRILSKKLSDIKIAKCTIQGAIDSLREVLKQLTNLQVEWNTMAQFFETTARNMGQANKEVQDVVAKMEDVHKQQKPLTKHLCENIIRGCIMAHGHTKFIQLTASMYVEVSQKYFTKELVALPRILTMSPREANCEVQRLQHQLLLNQSGIDELVSTKHAQMKKFMQNHAAKGRMAYVAIAAPAERYILEKQANEIEAQAMASASESSSILEKEEEEFARAKLAFTKDEF